MANLRNFVGVTTGTIGTGDVALGAKLPGHRTFLSAFVATVVTTYMILNNGEREVGQGTFNRDANTLTRNTLYSSTTGAKLNLSGTSQVYVTSAVEDFVPDWPAFIGFSNNGNTDGFTYINNSSGFTTLPLTNVVRDTYNAFDSSSFLWTCPQGQGGLYDCQAKLRLADESGPVNFGVGVDIANTDSDGFVWATFPTSAPNNRFVLYNSRLLDLIPGNVVRIFCYIDDSNVKAVNKASLSLLRVK